jgi:putative hydrolase of HD superfamily
VKDLDRFDMILTAFEYERHGRSQPGKTQEFFDTTRGKFHSQVVKDLVSELYKQREEFLVDASAANDGPGLDLKTPAS